MQSNRREFHRIPASGCPCEVSVDGVKLAGMLRDESISGARVSGLNLLMLPLNRKLQVSTRDGDFEGYVRNVARDENNLMDVGLRRVENAKEVEEESFAMLLNCFVEFQGNLVICVPLELQDDGVARVQLWDGKQFQIPVSTLVSLTRTERYEQLNDPAKLRFSADLYGFGPAATQHMVFEFEFGKMAACPTRNVVAGA